MSSLTAFRQTTRLWLKDLFRKKRKFTYIRDAHFQLSISPEQVKLSTGCNVKPQRAKVEGRTGELDDSVKGTLSQSRSPWIGCRSDSKEILSACRSWGNSPALLLMCELWGSTPSTGQGDQEVSCRAGAREKVNKGAAQTCSGSFREAGISKEVKRKVRHKRMGQDYGKYFHLFHLYKYTVQT